MEMCSKHFCILSNTFRQHFDQIRRRVLETSVFRHFSVKLDVNFIEENLCTGKIKLKTIVDKYSHSPSMKNATIVNCTRSSFPFLKKRAYARFIKDHQARNPFNVFKKVIYGKGRDRVERLISFPFISAIPPLFSKKFKFNRKHIPIKRQWKYELFVIISFIKSIEWLQSGFLCSMRIFFCFSAVVLLVTRKQQMYVRYE